MKTVIIQILFWVCAFSASRVFRQFSEDSSFQPFFPTCCSACKVIIITRTMFIVLSSMAMPFRKFTRVWMCPAPGGRQFVGQAAMVGYRRPNSYPSPFGLRLSQFTISRRVEGWVGLVTAVSVQPVPKAVYVAVIFMKTQTQKLSAARIRSRDLSRCSRTCQPPDHCDLQNRK